MTDKLKALVANPLFREGVRLIVYAVLFVLGLEDVAEAVVP